MASARTISIFSPKGGSGKTILASNLAAALSQEHKKILILDFDLKAPLDIAKTLNLSPKYSVCDFAELAAAKEAAALASQIKPHILKYSENLDYFPSIIKIRQLGYIKVDLVRRVFHALRDSYDYIIIDAGSDFTDVLIELFDNSNLIMMVVTPDVLSVYKTEWSLDTLQSLHFPLNMIKILLNRSESKGGFSWQEMRVVLPCEIIARIPSDGKAVNLSLNRQIPVVIDSPQSRFSQSVKKLAQDLIENKDIFVSHQPTDRAKLKSEMMTDVSLWHNADMLEPLKRRPEEFEDEVINLKRKIHHKLIDDLHLDHVSYDSSRMDAEKFQQLREKVERAITNLLSEETGKFISSLEVRKKLIGEITDEVLGLGPLEDLIKDGSITEIMVNNKDQIYIERKGRIELTTKKFISNEQIKSTIERIIAPLGRRIDESTPMVDARLTDGSRVNAIIPPLALTGPTLTIRKFAKKRLTIEELVEQYGSLSKDMAGFLEACVKIRRNIIVSGGTDSGKTTFLNNLSEFIPNGERVVTIEDAAELKLHHQHWIRLESRPPNIEGKGEITVRDLFRNSLRMRPDRIIVGEVRGQEVLDMLQAMNTGHDGSMSTVHANSTQDVLIRFDSMILMSGVELPLRAIREMISSAIELIVHTARMSDGSRKIIQVTEVIGMLDETRVNLKDIFVFKQTATGEDGTVVGKFVPTGYIPSFFEMMKVRGIQMSEDIFKPK